MMDQDDGQLELPLQLTQIGEQPGDLRRIVFIDPVQSDHGVEDQQDGPARFDRVAQTLLITPSSLIPNTGFAPILGGSSYIQAVTLTPGGPHARAVVTYSLSPDPASPHHADMTNLYSDYGWVKMPFAEGDIRRDPNLKVLHLTERR